MRFYNYINEFKKSSDSDNPGKISKVVIFDEKDRYSLEGKTHALWSHSIKHYIEFFPDYYNSILSSLSRYLKTVDYYVLSGSKTEKNGDFNDRVLMNTMDLINDKYFNKKPILPEEEYIINNFIIPLSEKYDEFFNLFIIQSVDITDFSIEQIKTNLNKNLLLKTDKDTLYANLKDFSFGVRDKTKGKATLYRYKDKESLVRKLKSFNFRNPNFKGMLDSI